MVCFSADYQKLPGSGAEINAQHIEDGNICCFKVKGPTYGKTTDLFCRPPTLPKSFETGIRTKESIVRRLIVSCQLETELNEHNLMEGSGGTVNDHASLHKGTTNGQT